MTLNMARAAGGSVEAISPSSIRPFVTAHTGMKFQATGEPETPSTEALTVRNGPLSIKPQQEGPLVVSGLLELCAGTGRVVARTNAARLCRCGGSAEKPFCDGTHSGIGFCTGRSLVCPCPVSCFHTEIALIPKRMASSGSTSRSKFHGSALWLRIAAA